MATVTPPRTALLHQNTHLLHVDPLFGTPSRRRPSFSVPDLDYKMKMMQLTLHFRASAAASSSSNSAARHSLGTFLRTEPTPGSVHQPKILAVEPKFKPVNAVKPCCSNPRPKVLVSVKSATLPIVPQKSKVRRLVQLFEDGSGTAVKPVKQLQIRASIKVKPVKKVEEVIQKVLTPPKSTVLVQQATKGMSPEPVKSTDTEMKEEPTKSSSVDDEAIKDALRQRRKVRELCKFFEQQAKI